MYYDAHTHLNSDQLFPDRQQHVKDFFTQEGKALVNIGVDHERNQRALTIAKQRNHKVNKTGLPKSHLERSDSGVERSS